MRLAALTLWFGLASLPVTAAECRQADYAGNAYSICTVDLNAETLELFLFDSDGDPY